MGAIRDLSRTLVLCAGAVALAASAQGTPLGLSVGDTITSISWDAMNSVPGDGAVFDVSLGSIGGLYADGQITSVTVAGPTTILQSNVDLRFDLDLVSQTLNTGNFPIVFGNAYFGGAAAVTPDFVVKENGVNILWGNFTSLVRVGGELNVAETGDQTLSSVALVTITGGDASLVDALGGAGVAQADLLLTAQLSDFNPELANLASNGNIYDTNFNVTLSGTLTPRSPSPFVPEPGTALLLGTGLVGLLAAARRYGKR